MTKVQKDAPKQKDGEKKQNLKDSTDVTSVDKNLNPPMKQKLTVFKILHYKKAMWNSDFQLLLLFTFKNMKIIYVHKCFHSGKFLQGHSIVNIRPWGYAKRLRSVSINPIWQSTRFQRQVNIIVWSPCRFNVKITLNKY